MVALSTVLVLVAGLAVLWWAGGRAVRYAIELTELLGVSSFVVGFVVMSVATGLPEITTAALSVAADAAGLSAGDLLGSSLVNLSLVLGLAAVAGGPLALQDREERSLLSVLAIITGLVSVILFTAHLTVWHGVLLLASYAATIAALQYNDVLRRVVREEEREAREDLAEAALLRGPWGTTLKFLASLAVVVVGARLTVDSAVTVATGRGVPLETVGATVVAVGTGLPELTLELQAVKRGEYALALGDIFGSTLVNLTLVLGLLSIFSPTTVAVIPLLGTVVYLGLAVALIWWMMLHAHGISRRHGVLLVVLFVLYLVEEVGVLRFVYHVV